MADFWAPLYQELSIWRELGWSIPLWWRDDDAIEPTPALTQLAELSYNVGLPVHLAVIPEFATKSLQEFVKEQPLLVPVTHGYGHHNHAFSGEKKMEFGAHRESTEIICDINAGLARMDTLFGADAGPMFVPPWNRIGVDVYPMLSREGYQYLSTYNPRSSQFVANGLQQVNTHVDPINWRGNRSVVDPAQLINQTLRLLVDRRNGVTDRAEPLGLLTHHLVQDDAIWGFCADWLNVMMSGPVTVWTMSQKGK